MELAAIADVIVRDAVAVAARRGLCCYCGRVLAREGGPQSPRYPTVEHVHPQSLGGTNDPGNLMICCRTCNCSKGGKTVEDFRNSIAFKRLGFPLFVHRQTLLWLIEQGRLTLTWPTVVFHFEMDQARAAAEVAVA